MFRLSRIDGDVRFSGPAGSVIVPKGTDVRETVREWDTHPPAQRTAVLRVRPGAGHGIRRHATPLLDSAGLDSAGLDGAGAGLDSADAAGPDGSGLALGSTRGWDMISVPFSDVGWFADHLASFGADLVVLEPADLREAVIRRLKGVLA